MQTKVTTLSKIHYRIECPCGDYVIEVKRGDDGELVWDTFMVGGSKKKSPPSDIQPEKKKRKFTSLFDDDEEEKENE